MERYRITTTTDGKYVGKIFTVNEDAKVLDIQEIEDDPRLSEYQTIKKQGNQIRLTNVHYTINGTLI